MNRHWLPSAVIFLVCWAMTTHGKYSVSGDEPHYLLMSESLWADGDLDLRNNYQNDDGRRFGAAGLQVERHAIANQSGALWSVHDIGVPLLLTPSYASATALSRVSSESILGRFRMSRGLFAYSLISLCIIALVTATAALVRASLIDQGSTPGLASLIVIALWLSPPILSNSFLVFPEPFALFVTALAVWVAFSNRPIPFWIAASLATALGCLPWMHRKFVVYGAALALAVLWERRESLAKLVVRERLTLLALFTVPQLGLGLWSWYYWGTLGGPLTLEGVPLSWDAFKSGTLGQIVDRENGLLVWAPIYALLGCGWVLAGRRYAAWLLPPVALFALTSAHHLWWAGFSPAARFLVPMVPIFASVAASAIRHRRFAWVCLVLLLPQLFISADGWQHTRDLWPQGNGHNRVLSDLLGVVGIPETIVPSLRTSPQIASGIALLVGISGMNVLAWFALRDRRVVSALRRTEKAG